MPAIDMIIVPVGGGSGASGCCLVKEALSPAVEVVAVQAKNAPAAYLSWKEKSIVQDKMETVAEGLATQVGFELTQEILQKYLADFVLVTEEEMEKAILVMLELVRNLVEDAGASPLAAALKIKEKIAGKKVTLIITGGNLSIPRLRSILGT